MVSNPYMLNELIQRIHNQLKTEISSELTLKPENVTIDQRIWFEEKYHKFLF